MTTPTPSRPNMPSAADAAQTAAEAIRRLNHLTAPHAGYPGLDLPGDLYDTLAALTATTQRLDQSLHQLSRWIVDQNRTGRITTPGRAGATNDTVAALTEALDGATQHITATADNLKAAWSASAVLASAGAEPSRDMRSDAPRQPLGLDPGAGL